MDILDGSIIDQVVALVPSHDRELKFWSASHDLSDFAVTEFDEGTTDRGIKTVCCEREKGYNMGEKKNKFNCSRHSHIPIRLLGSPSRV